MNFEIIEEAIRFRLHGIGGSVENERYQQVGFALMNELWRVVKSAPLDTTGINHWVYLPDGMMFVGVELRDPPPTSLPAELKPLEFSLPRYLKHTHRGSYQQLPQTWKALKAELKARGEEMAAPVLEIYGHPSEDPAKTETNILIGLQSNGPKTIDQAAFASIYAGQPRWDIGRPQQAFLDVADRMEGSLLDSGCGTGELALFFAERGLEVTGIDFLAEPIAIAKRKAVERNLRATFLQSDALTLIDWPNQFDNVIDSGLFHVFSDGDRRRYVAGIAKVLKPQGRFFLLCFSDAEPGTQGPRRITRGEIDATFADGWTIESVTPSHYEVRPDQSDEAFNRGGPKAWFVVAKRAG
jgi:SAM-dependent methyltransferase